MNKRILHVFGVGLLAALLSACSSLQGLGDQLNAVGTKIQGFVDEHSSSNVVYKSPNVTKNGLLVLGSTWSQINSHLEAVRDKQTGTLSYQAVVAVTYMRQGQYKQIRNYQWSDVEVSKAPALQTLFIQDAQDAPVVYRAMSDCNPAGVCKQEALTAALDQGLLKDLDHDLLVQVHAGRDSNNVPLHPAIATFTPAYVKSFLDGAKAAPGATAQRD